MAMDSWAVLAAAALVSGCAATMDQGGEPPLAGGGPCDADAAQQLVGGTADVELAERAMALSGAREFRWIPPNSAVTMDYRPTRLNVEYDEDSVVTAIRCG